MERYCKETVIEMKVDIVKCIEKDILLFLSLFFQMLSYGVCQILGVGILSVIFFGIATLLAIFQSLFIIKTKMLTMTSTKQANLFFSIILELMLAVTFGANLNTEFISHILYISVSYYFVIVFQLIQLILCIREKKLYIKLTRYHCIFLRLLA